MPSSAVALYGRYNALCSQVIRKDAGMMLKKNSAAHCTAFFHSDITVVIQ